MKIFNTFGFTPNFTEDSGIKLVDSEVKGAIVYDDGVTKGKEVVAHIRENANNTFLVSQKAFEGLTGEGFRNVCMFDPHNKADNNSWYGGVIFA